MGDPDDIEVEVVLAAVKSDELNEIDEMVRRCLLLLSLFWGCSDLALRTML